MRSRLRDGALGLVAVLAVAVLWELYKALGPAEGWTLGSLRVLPRTSDLAMPHIWDMLARLTEPASYRGDDRWESVTAIVNLIPEGATEPPGFC